MEQTCVMCHDAEYAKVAGVVKSHSETNTSDGRVSRLLYHSPPETGFGRTLRHRMPADLFDGCKDF